MSDPAPITLGPSTVASAPTITPSWSTTGPTMRDEGWMRQWRPVTGRAGDTPPADASCSPRAKRSLRPRSPCSSLRSNTGPAAGRSRLGIPRAARCRRSSLSDVKETSLTMAAQAPGMSEQQTPAATGQVTSS